MTRHRIILIRDTGVQYFDFGEDIVKAEEIEYIIRQNKGVQSVTLGDINGLEYITIYHIPREAEE